MQSFALLTSDLIHCMYCYHIDTANRLTVHCRREKICNGDINEELDDSERRKFDRRLRTYPYRSHLQWARAYYGLTGCLLAVLFLGWSSFLRPFHSGQFVAAYISVSIDATMRYEGYVR